MQDQSQVSEFDATLQKRKELVYTSNNRLDKRDPLKKKEIHEKG